MNTWRISLIKAYVVFNRNPDSTLNVQSSLYKLFYEGLVREFTSPEFSRHNNLYFQFASKKSPRSSCVRQSVGEQYNAVSRKKPRISGIRVFSILTRRGPVTFTRFIHGKSIKRRRVTNAEYMIIRYTNCYLLAIELRD